MTITHAEQEVKDTKQTLPNGFVYLSDVCPSIKQDIKYANEDNFTGQIVVGYEKPAAILTKEAAEKLCLIQKKLEQNNMGFLVWDAYRPALAVEFFLDWGAVPDNSKIKKKYYPDFTKEELFDIGFIAKSSSHSRGSTVDLTIINADGEPIEMGTIFDYFSDKSSTNYIKLPEHIKKNRQFLKELMHNNGFTNFKQEWWHYTLDQEPFPNTYFNFPVK